MSMNPAPPPPAAGWYPTAVASEERWWDGSAWTDATRPMPATQPAKPFWGGNKDGYLAASIVASVLALPIALATLGSLLNGDWRFIPEALFFFLLVFMAVLGFVNYGVLSRRTAAARAMQAPAAAQTPVVEPQPPVQP